MEVKKKIMQYLCLYSLTGQEIKNIYQYAFHTITHKLACRENQPILSDNSEPLSPRGTG